MDNSKSVNVRLQNARDIKENWEQNNPVLLPGELAIVFNVKDDPLEAKLKIGNGISSYSDLPFYNEADLNHLGQPNGLATLGSDGKIPVSQLPSDLFANCIKLNISLSRLGWVESDNEEYPYAYYFYNDNLTENMHAEMFILPESTDIVAEAGLNPDAETGEGYIKVFAQSIPKGNIKVSLFAGNVDVVNIEQNIATPWIGYYGANRAVLLLPGYELLILESDHIGKLTEADKRGKKCLGYVAIAEVVSGRWFYDEYCKDQAFIVEMNTDWGSYRINPASEEWQNILLNVVIPKIVEDLNYDGVFFDVCDVGEYLEGNWPNQYPGAIQGIADIIEAVKEKYPNKIIACNGGYTPILMAKDSIDYYVVESAIGTWWLDSNGNVHYRNSTQEARNWIWPRVTTIQNNGLPILDWEYGTVADEDRVYEIMREADAKGWSPFVTVRSVDWFPGLEVPSEGGNIPETPPVANKISFIAASDGAGINFFAGTGCQLPSANKFKVYINDEEADQSYISLTFSAGDKVDIQLTDTSSYYPMFKPGNWDSAKVLDYIKNILEPFPSFYADATGYRCIDFANHMTMCRKLETIPEGLYRNNTAATTFYYAFSNCNSLQAVPAELFAGCTEITTFENAFADCYKLTSVATDLFEYSPKVTGFRYAFANSNLCPFVLKIVSPNVTGTRQFVTASSQVSAENRVVMIPAGTTTEDSFRVVTETGSNCYGLMTIVTY